jgi:hypothetical protein
MLTEIRLGIAGAIRNGISNLGIGDLGTEQLGDLTNFTQNLGASLHDVIVGAASMTTQITGAIGTTIVDAITGITADDLKTAGVAVGGAATAVAGAISGFLYGLVTGEDASEWSLADFTGEVADKILTAIGDISWDTLTNPFGLLAETLTGWIGDEIDDAVAAIVGLPGFKQLNSLMGWLGLPTYLTQNQQTANTIRNTMLPPNVMADEDNWLRGRQPNAGGDSSLITGPMAFRAPAGPGAVNLGTGLPTHTLHPVVGHPLYGEPFEPVTGPFRPGSETVVPARLDLDTSPFKGTFDLDIDRASEKKTEAMNWGKAWSDEVFRSTFDGDNGPAALKYTDAFTWGTIWSEQTFTARFSVDLGPLEAARIRVAELAGEISDLLPRSPAKRGPLARPISFAYIGDAMRSAMRSMARDAEVGMSALTGTLAGPVPLAARARPTGGTTINIITIPPDEWLELARAVERGESIDLNLARELAVRKAKAVS